MTSEIPNYLRLHTEESFDAQRSLASGDESLAHFRQSFEQATGWRIQVEETLSAPSQAAAGVADTAPSLTPSTPSSDSADSPPIDLPRARSLAIAFSDLTEKLQQTRAELQRREAELAAGVPVRARRNEKQHLAVRLESVLKGGAQAVGCQAAALFSLDDATTQLKLRASWGIPADRMMQPPRPLRGAVADLEALIGQAVVLEDTSVLPNWHVPEAFASAVCVPVSSPTEPLGTLWMFCDHVRPFSDEQTNLIEIIAGRVAAELQREALLRECVTSKQIDQQLTRASKWQQSRLPNVKPLLDDWELAGAVHHDQLLSPGCYDWFVPTDGSLAVSIGHCEGSMIESALTMASVQGFLRAHADHTADSAKLLALVNETLWNTTPGGQFASIFHASINPECGALTCASAGYVHAHVIGPNGIRPVTSPTPPMGTELDGSTESCLETIMSGEVFVAVSPGVASHPEASPQRLAYLDLARRQLDLSAEELLAEVRGSLQSQAAERREPNWSVLVIKRR